MAEKTATPVKTSKQSAKRKAAEQRATEQAAKPTLENVYEAMFLLGAGSAAEPQAGLDLARGFIERHGGKIKVLKKWDERKLAYEVNGQKRGTYVIAYFTAPGNAVAAIERDVKLSEDVLRVLVTKADHLNEQEMNAVEPQPIQPREERNPWDRPDFNRPPRRDDRRDDRGPREDRAPRREEEAASKD
ncbi:MAG TPA: 30S ribosomal protein S6 [Tepidisphaeraceae bacterium]|nr:30S ribosomal protein S6 [Tepidisphaeraceae bacterium]